MTIALTYLDDLSRVRIALSDLPDGTVHVERSPTASFVFASPVRGGVALPISGGTGQVDDYEFFADVVNHYRVTPLEPPAGLQLDGTAGNYASTPDAPPLDVTGDLRLSAEAALHDWTSTDQTFVAKFSDPGQRSYLFRVRDTGQLRLTISTDGSVGLTFDSPNPVPFGLGQHGAVRVDLDVDDGAGTSVAQFYWAPTIDGPWTSLGSDTRSDASAGIFVSTAPLEVGSWDGGTRHLLSGAVQAVRVEDVAAGGVVANPDFAAQTTGDISFTDDAGRTWTVNGTASITGSETATITPSLDGQVWLKSIWYPAQNRPFYRLLDRNGNILRPARDQLASVSGRAAPTADIDLRGSRRFDLFAQVPDEAAADALDLILAAGRVFFVHVPPEMDGCVPGGYVRIGDTTQGRRTTQQRWVFRLPCTVVAPPGPDVVGTTLTVRGLIRLQNTVDAVWAAYPTIRDLWDTIGSLDDPVVI